MALNYCLILTDNHNILHLPKILNDFVRLVSKISFEIAQAAVIS